VKEVLSGLGRHWNWWADPATGKENLVRWKLFIFFTPRDESTTLLTTFLFTKSRYPGPAGCMRAVRWLLRRKIDHEIRLDMRILEGLADQSADIEGMKLSRFDKVLALNRERINRVYRGIEPNPWPACGDRINRAPMPGIIRCAGRCS
jgi:hypothetical protein